MLQRVSQFAQNRYVGVAVASSLLGVVLLLLFLLIRGPRDTVVLQVEPLGDSSEIFVYVGGDVARPGLYSLTRGSRVFDAINAAGGLLQSADTSTLGLASPLKDADQIIVPSRPATLPAKGSGPTTIPAEATATAHFTTPVPFAQVPTAQVTSPSRPININSASADELDQLPGIGPAIAARVIEYRLQQGPFQTLDELAEVSGISDRMVDEWRPLITLGH